MVKGALEKLQTDYAIAATGLMGPASDGESKPVGTVWLAVGDKDNISTIQLNLRFERTVNIHYTGLQALNLLRKFLNTNS